MRSLQSNKNFRKIKKILVRLLFYLQTKKISENQKNFFVVQPSIYKQKIFGKSKNFLFVNKMIEW